MYLVDRQKIKRKASWDIEFRKAMSVQHIYVSSFFEDNYEHERNASVDTLQF